MKQNTKLNELSTLMIMVTKKKNRSLHFKKENEIGQTLILVFEILTVNDEEQSLVIEGHDEDVSQSNMESL